MNRKENNSAYIDMQNLQRGVRDMGWVLDFEKFYEFLVKDMNVKNGYIFVGYLKEKRNFYRYLSRIGYKLIFKKVSRDKNRIKANVDAEIVVQIMDDLCRNSFDKAVLITADGDFTCVFHLLKGRNRLKKLIIPNF